MRSSTQSLFVGLLLFSGVIAAAFRLADDPFINRLVEQFRAYHQQRPVEKVYVHTDRDAYAIGETLWLKGYLVSGSDHTTDTVSRVLYVDLVDPVARRVRLRTQLRAPDGFAPGQLFLPDSLPVGTYQLRAYTNFMRNYSEAYFFAKTLTILQPGAAAPGAVTDAASRRIHAGPDVQFMPEGGQLVEGLEARVAFKAVDASGRGVDVNGFVLNARKDTVAGLNSTHLGMGTITIVPEAGQTYTAFVRLSDGQLAPYPVPAGSAQGVTMQVDNLTNKDKVRVYVRHNKSTADAAAALTLVAQTRGQIGQVAKIPLARKTAVVQLSRAEFPEGIAQLTLFDETNQPVCERLVFIDKNERLNVTLTPTRPTYGNRQAVELTVTTTDAQSKPVAANLSLAAVDARLSPEVDSNAADFTSHLLLSSDLTGTIERPGYYFDPAHADRLQKLDLLLMTQGWRRFTWPDVLAGKEPVFKYPLEQGLSLTGRVLRLNRKPVESKINLTFILAKRDSTGTDSRRDFLAGESDEFGNFAAYDLDFTDTTTVLIQATRGKANRDLVITLDQLLTPTVTITRVPYNPVELRHDHLTEFLRRTSENVEIERQIRRNREVLLEAVTVKAKKYQAPDSRRIYSSADATVKFDQSNTAGRLTVLDVIQGRVAGVQVMGSGFNARVQIRGAANFGGAIEPLFVVDGMRVDLQGVMSLSVQDVDQVDVLKGPSAAIYGSRAAGGVISILTKRGSPNYDLTREAVPGTLVAKLPGYAPVREFYAPRYDVKKPEPIKPDYRTTLFWAPMIRTNAEGKATVTFFTSDAKTNLRIRAEGITPNGMPGVGQTSLRVD